MTVISSCRLAGRRPTPHPPVTSSVSAANRLSLGWTCAQQRLLVALAGRPGTGKTTLARRLAAELRAAYVRTDAIATAIIGEGLTDQPPAAGRVAYVVAREIVSGTLQVGTPVVVDGVNAVHQLRGDWVALARSREARLVMLGTTLSDAEEHRRRVEQRLSDLGGQVVPTWARVQAQPYDAWDEGQDGPRNVIDTSDADHAVEEALRLVGSAG